MRLTRQDVKRIAASFAGIPTLTAVVVTDDGSGTPRILDVEIGEDAPGGCGKPAEGDGNSG